MILKYLQRTLKERFCLRWKGADIWKSNFVNIFLIWNEKKIKDHVHTNCNGGSRWFCRMSIKAGYLDVFFILSVLFVHHCIGGFTKPKKKRDGTILKRVNNLKREDRTPWDKMVGASGWCILHHSEQRMYLGSISVNIASCNYVTFTWCLSTFITWDFNLYFVSAGVLNNHSVTFGNQNSHL